VLLPGALLLLLVNWIIHVQCISHVAHFRASLSRRLFPPCPASPVWSSQLSQDAVYSVYGVQLVRCASVAAAAAADVSGQ